MNDILEPPVQTTQSAPSASTPVAVAPKPATPPVSTKKSGPPYGLIAGAVLLFIVAFVVIGFLTTRTGNTTPTPVTPSPSVFATPTPVLNQSALASTSAFFEFSRENASFSGILESFVLQDPSLTAPVFDTEVTFSQ